VLIVDDHFLFAEALAGAVREVGTHEVVGIAVTGAQAVSLARERNPDIVLLDYHLPGYEGHELVARVHSASPRSRIIVVTSDITETSLARATEAGADAYITKDLAIEDVVQAVRQAVESLRAEPPVPAEGVLTQRELGILRMVAEGLDVKRISGELGVSAHTVRTHLQNIYSKLDAHSQVEAVAIARRKRLIP
jgi:DNA-binding NarL/FixJ family response regulator